MLYTGSYSFLKNHLLKLYNTAPPGSRFTFIVFTNQMAGYLKEFLAENRGIIANTYFYTPIDISRKLTSLEPLQDFERDMVFRRFLYRRGYFLDGLPEDFGLLVQHIKEYSIPLENIRSGFTRQIINDYTDFLATGGYLDREDVHLKALDTDTDFYTDYMVIFGIRTLPPLYQRLFKKLKSLSGSFHVFLPILENSGYYQNYVYFSEVIDFYKSLTEDHIEEKEYHPNIEAGRRIYRFEYTEPVKSSNIRIFKAADFYSQVEYVAQQILELLQSVPPYRIGVVLPLQERYTPVLKAVFDKYGIPYTLTEEVRYVDEPLYARLLNLILLKEGNFSVEKIQSVLSEELINTGDIDAIEEILREFEGLEGFQLLKEMVFPSLDKRFVSLLDAVNFPEEGKLDDFLQKLESVTDYLKNLETVEFLRMIIEELSQSSLYRRLYENITFREFAGIIRSFFSREREKVKVRYPAVKVVSPTEAEGHNFSALFFLNLNSGEFPLTAADEILAGAEELGGFDYPFHLLMHQLAGFVSLLDRETDIYLLYTENQGKTAPSVIIEELLRITGTQPVEVKTKGILLEDFLMENALWLWQVDGRMKQIKERWDRWKRISTDDFYIQEAVPEPPLYPSVFSSYIKCPYRYFYTGIAGFRSEDTDQKRRISPTGAGEVIHKVLYRFYRDLPYKNPEEYFHRNKNNIRTQIVEGLRPLLDQVIPPYRPFELKMIEKTADRIVDFIQRDLNRMKIAGRTIVRELLEREVEDKNGIFRGRIDRVETDKDGNLYVYDYKTGRKPVRNGLNDRELIREFSQIVIYSKILKEKGHRVKEAGIFAVLDGDGFYTVDDEHRISEAERTVWAYIGELLRGNFVPKKDRQVCYLCQLAEFCPVEFMEENQ